MTLDDRELQTIIRTIEKALCAIAASYRRRGAGERIQHAREMLAILDQFLLERPRYAKPAIKRFRSAFANKLEALKDAATDGGVRSNAGRIVGGTDFSPAAVRIARERRARQAPGKGS